MPARKLGFISSWKQLTQDKGWVVPVLILALIGWVPIIGQLALFGYGLEWARLTAWGADSAPKRKGLDISKMLKTGGIALLVAASMSVVLALFDWLVFGDVLVLTAFPAGAASASRSMEDILTSGSFDLLGGTTFIRVALLLVVNVLAGQVIAAAVMRATIYDSFSAGWRLDRIFQMIGRDLGGFLHTYAVSLVGSFLVWIFSSVVSLVGTLTIAGGALGTMAMAAANGGLSSNGGGMASAIVSLLMQVGPSTILLLLLLAALFAYIGSALAIVVQLISMNAMGQWFQRFEVGRWGVSSAPLPSDVPAGETAPVDPATNQNA